MASQISVLVLLLLGCSLHGVYSEDTTVAPTSESTSTTIEPTSSTTSRPAFTTCTDFGGMPVDLKAFSGFWYEAARVPDVPETQCLRYTWPEKPNADNKLVIQLNFVDATDNKWVATENSGTLPWDDNSKNGIFTWNLGTETIILPATFKLVNTDYEKYAFFCGYVGIAPVPLFKVLTRKRELTAEDKTLVQQKFNEYVKNTDLKWSEQNEQRCNSAMRLAGGAIVALALALLFRQRNF